MLTAMVPTRNLMEQEDSRKPRFRPADGHPGSGVGGKMYELFGRSMWQSGLQWPLSRNQMGGDDSQYRASGALIF